MRTALVFDLDDTLYPERQFVKSGFAAAGAFLDRRGLAEGRVFFHKAVQVLEQGHRGHVFNLALREMGLPETPGLIEDLVRAYREHQPALTLYEDADWALERFRPHCRLGVLTDGYWQVQRQKVQALGVARRVDAIVYSDRFGRDNWKPSAVPYREMMRLLDCDGARCVYVGDNPAKDFVTAKRLGWLTVQVRRPEGEYAQVRAEASHRADHAVESLYELEEWLEGVVK